MSRLSLTQLATLQAFVRTGTLAAAADHLGYTPGAVSQHVSALEKALGARLVERSGRQLVLTDAGRVLAEYADRMLPSSRRRRMRSPRSRAGSPGHSRSAPGAAPRPLCWHPSSRRMAAAFPEVTVRSREVDLDEAAVAVATADVDVAFGLDYADAPLPRDDGIAVIALHEETFGIAVAATPAGPDSGRSTSRRWRSWTGSCPRRAASTGRALRAGFRRRGFEPRVVHEVTDTAASLQLAAAGLGATVMTDLMRRLNPSSSSSGWRWRTP